MVSYLILCRSLTFAQRTARILKQAGISGVVMRAPRSIAGEGCGYCVKISERWLSKSLILLRREGLEPKQIFIQTGDDDIREVKA